MLSRYGLERRSLADLEAASRGRPTGALKRRINRSIEELLARIAARDAVTVEPLGSLGG